MNSVHPFHSSGSSSKTSQLLSQLYQFFFLSWDNNWEILLLLPDEWNGWTEFKLSYLLIFICFSCICKADIWIGLLWNISLILGTAIFFLLSNKTKFNTWSLLSQSWCISVLEHNFELFLHTSSSCNQKWCQSVILSSFWYKVTKLWIRFCSLVGKIEL